MITTEETLATIERITQHPRQIENLNPGEKKFHLFPHKSHLHMNISCLRGAGTKTKDKNLRFIYISTNKKDTSVQRVHTYWKIPYISDVYLFGVTSTRTFRSRTSESRPTTHDPSCASNQVRPSHDSIPCRLRRGVKPTCSSPHHSAILVVPTSSAALCLEHNPFPVLMSHLLCNICPTIATYVVYHLYIHCNIQMKHM
jgi:hypothetical protein